MHYTLYTIHYTLYTIHYTPYTIAVAILLSKGAMDVPDKYGRTALSVANSDIKGIFLLHQERLTGLVAMEATQARERWEREREAQQARLAFLQNKANVEKQTIANLYKSKREVKGVVTGGIESGTPGRSRLSTKQEQREALYQGKAAATKEAQNAQHPHITLRSAVELLTAELDTLILKKIVLEERREEDGCMHEDVDADTSRLNTTIDAVKTLLSTVTLIEPAPSSQSESMREPVSESICQPRAESEPEPEPQTVSPISSPISSPVPVPGRRYMRGLYRVGGLIGNGRVPIVHNPAARYYGESLSGCKSTSNTPPHELPSLAKIRANYLAHAIHFHPNKYARYMETRRDRREIGEGGEGSEGREGREKEEGEEEKEEEGFISSIWDTAVNIVVTDTVMSPPCFPSGLLHNPSPKAPLSPAVSPLST